MALAKPQAALLCPAPCPGDSLLVDLDDDDIGVTTDGAIFDVFLMVAGGGIDRHDDFFAAAVAEVACVVNHGCD